VTPERRHVRASLVALLAAATLCALLFVNAMTLEGIRSSRPWIAHNRETQAALSRMRAALVDAETGQRGFLLTGDSDYLEPFKATDETMPMALAELKRLTTDDHLLQRGVAEIERLALQKMAEIHKTIDLYRRSEPSAALAIVHSNEGKALMDDARRVIAEMRAQEDLQLEERTSATRRKFDRATWIDAGAGLGLLVLGLILFAVHRDIARREVLENALREAARIQQQFIGILSHDLRNPLSAILMTTGQLERAFPATHSDAVRRIASSTVRMSRMIHQLLDLTGARLGDGIPVEPQPETNLSEVVRTAVEELMAAHPEAHVKMEVDEGVDGAWDPDRMGQVVSNLVANAIAYGDGPVHVRVSRANGSAILEVHNGGASIPADVLPRIFEPFRRATHDGETSARGLGLGLFIAERIVAAHGGKIDVRSADAEGTTFTVGLPLSG
jgi:signal transduction histidine kinase